MEVRMDVVVEDLFMDDLVCFVMYHRLMLTIHLKGQSLEFLE